MHDIHFIDVDKEFEGVANDEYQDNTHQYTSYIHISAIENVILVNVFWKAIYFSRKKQFI